MTPAVAPILALSRAQIPFTKQRHAGHNEERDRKGDKGGVGKE